ncbi:MAG: TonB-dependent receptor [Calditrichaceae bacterium]|nr:TonB-dependent receptor [Calditrichia bacterium]NUQ41080.1 TonB-dependent receptor [Calditrichaceae bacterium]
MKCLICFLGIFVVQFSNAQQVDGNFSGRVFDENNQPVMDAEITLQGPGLQGIRGTISDESGYFKMLAIPVGSYTVKIHHLAYQTLVFEDITIYLGKTTNLGPVQLFPKSIELPEVVITDVKPGIDPFTTTIGTNLTLEDIEPLPSDRGFRSLVTLSPQANISYFGDEANIAGSTGIENMYFIDGINVTEPQRANTSTNLPYNFVKEVQVKTGGYEAEYRSALGGAVNVITQSGSNQLHGQVFGYFTNNTLAKNRRLLAGESGVANFTQADVGFSLGGPIAKDKLWYFAAYNPNFQKEDVEIPGFGFYEDSKTAHIFAGKLTWRASDKTQVNFSIFGDPSAQIRIGPGPGTTPSVVSLENIDPYWGDWKAGGVNSVLWLQHFQNKNLLLEGNVSHLTQKFEKLASTKRGAEEPIFTDFTSGIVSGGYGFQIKDQTARTSISVHATFFYGRHIFKGGLEYEDNFLDFNEQSTSDGAGNIYKFGDSLYFANEVRIVGEVGNRIPSVFLQDSWLIAERLRINLGLRWDGQYFYGADGALAQKIEIQFQPRMGIIYQPGELGSQKIFASYGRFYEQIPLFFAALRFIPITDRRTYFDHNPLVDPLGGDTLDLSRPALKEIEGLRGQYFDELSLGYERQIDQQFKFAIKGIYRNLGEAVDDGFCPEAGFVTGNPGRGNLSCLPRFTRQYTALELTLEKFNSRKLNFTISYVLSKNHGNYAGLYNSETGFNDIPHIYRTLDFPEQVPNSTGLLPNDRTHVFRFFGHYRFNFGLLIGASCFWQSGTPLTEFGGTTIGLPFQSFLSERGSAGRTPAIFDLNLRLSYDLNSFFTSKLHVRAILDAFHIRNDQEVVNIDQVHFFSLDENGNQGQENPNYLQPTAFQPPMSARLGLEVSF